MFRTLAPCRCGSSGVKAAYAAWVLQKVLFFLFFWGVGGVGWGVGAGGVGMDGGRKGGGRTEPPVSLITPANANASLLM